MQLLLVAVDDVGEDAALGGLVDEVLVSRVEDEDDWAGGVTSSLMNPGRTMRDFPDFAVSAAAMAPAAGLRPSAARCVAATAGTADAHPRQSRIER